MGSGVWSVHHLGAESGKQRPSIFLRLPSNSVTTVQELLGSLRKIDGLCLPDSATR
jgi:hypothetical protein